MGISPILAWMPSALQQFSLEASYRRWLSTSTGARKRDVEREVFRFLEKVSLRTLFDRIDRPLADPF